MLPYLTDEDLRSDLEISSGIHRKEILRTVAHLVRSNALPGEASAAFAPCVGAPSAPAVGEYNQEQDPQLHVQQGHQEQEEGQHKPPPLQAVPVLFPDGDSAM